MSEEREIDFTLLDPSRDRAHWEQMIDSVVERTCARRRSHSVGAQVRAWARPALAMAAAMALAVWAGALLSDAPTPPADPAQLLSQWAVSGEVPSTTKILEVLGGDHVAQ